MPQKAEGIVRSLPMPSPVQLLARTAHIGVMPALFGHQDDCVWVGPASQCCMCIFQREVVCTAQPGKGGSIIAFLFTKSAA